MAIMLLLRLSIIFMLLCLIWGKMLKFINGLEVSELVITVLISFLSMVFFIACYLTVSFAFLPRKGLKKKALLLHNILFGGYDEETFNRCLLEASTLPHNQRDKSSSDQKPG
ncbi:hypothetical protein [Neomoorella thermoacetica]|nr:hypothetical protein [Moorella thermoacetica]